MPLHFLRRLTGRHRTESANRLLGFVLAFVAGATNAGGLMVIGQYTSHMTGMLSALADHLVLGSYHLAWVGLMALCCFVVGASTTSILVNFSRRHNLHSQYALPLLFEAGLLLMFGLLGVYGWEPLTHRASWIVWLLCYMMGLQNAVVTKLSGARIRTTHVTGIMTDIGIEIGRALFANWQRFNRDGIQNPFDGQNNAARIQVDVDKLKLLLGLVTAFFTGGLSGAWSFNQIGFVSVLPLAFLLLLFAGVPVFDDLSEFFRRRRTP